MLRVYGAALTAAVLMTSAYTAAYGQQAQPAFATTKVEGTDNVYIFRNGNHQSMFVVTKDGVIATDPIGYGRPTGGQTYVDEIKKVTDKPIKYLVYSHPHFDHICRRQGIQGCRRHHPRPPAGEGAPWRCSRIRTPAVPIPDQVVGDQGRNITLGGTTLEKLKYFGLQPFPILRW